MNKYQFLARVRSSAVAVLFVLGLGLRACAGNVAFPHIDGAVISTAIQPDGRILAGGSFTKVGEMQRNGIARFYPDGTLDPDFAPAAARPGRIGGLLVHALAVQSDGKILVGGTANDLHGWVRTELRRLNPDGSLDTGFNANLDFGAPVKALLLQPDGKIVVGGEFYDYATGYGGLLRLNQDGTIDPSFTTANTSYIDSLALQSDGKILSAGYWGVSRWNTNGTIDPSFTLDGFYQNSAIAFQADGKILLARNVDGYLLQTNIIRLAATGSVDPTFSVQSDGGISSIAVLTDGRILVAGSFTHIAGQACTNLARLNPDGSFDKAFSLETLNELTSMSIASNGDVVLGACVSWSMPNSIHLMRVDGAGSATQTLSVSSNTVTWLRGGTSPEVTRVLFETCNDGENWRVLGYGSRISGGWVLRNVVVPDNSSLRARGFVAGGQEGKSSGFVETFTGAPAISIQPGNRTKDAASTTVFDVSGGGSEPTTYQWRKDGMDLADSGIVSGANTARLFLSNVFGADAGNYCVVMSNAFGCATSRVAVLSVIDPIITLDPVSRTSEPGELLRFEASALGTQPVMYQWQKNGKDIANATDSSFSITNAQIADAASYTLLASNSFGIATSAVAMITINAITRDNTFAPTNAMNWPYAMTLQSDGKILTACYLGTSTGYRQGLWRTEPTGALDETFEAPGLVNQYAVGAWVDGKIITSDWQASQPDKQCLPRTRLLQLNNDGSLDKVITCSSGDYRFDLLPGGKILVGSAQLERFNPDGTLDAMLNPTNEFSYNCYAVQPDGKLVLAGWTENNSMRVFRINSDGSKDEGFHRAIVSGRVNCIAVQPDGRILLGGSFTHVDDQERGLIARLDPDGQLDPTLMFSVIYSCSSISSILLQANGKIVAGGGFYSIAGFARQNLARFNADGTLDLNFNPDVPFCSALALQPDGKILVNGTLRLNNNEPASEELLFDSSSITWVRSGSCPEIRPISFEVSTNGVDWINLGPGMRCPSGWQVAGLTLPSELTVRTRGVIATGFENRSSWVTEATSGRLMITKQPVSVTNDYGSTATIQISLAGSSPLVCQWQKNGTNLEDSERVLGTKTLTLKLANVTGADAGDYLLIISNAFGSVTSSLTRLSVVEPLITENPQDMACNAGDLAGLNVSAVGTEPLSYQWRKDGIVLSGASTPSLAFCNLQANDIGTYDVVISNIFGCTTSAPASLLVNLAIADSFNPGANGSVASLLVQPDGNIIVGGYFQFLGGQPRMNLGRLLADGTLDPSFDPQPNNLVTCLAMQTDRKILVSGYFTSLARQECNRIGRLNADGSLDSSFRATADHSIVAMALQPNGQIVVGGEFTTLCGQARNRLGRLNADGTLDESFNPVLGSLYDWTSALALQPNGKVLVSRSSPWDAFVTRLNPDGTAETNFNIHIDGTVRCFLVQPDGSILIAGEFSHVEGHQRTGLARLLPNGVLDESFTPYVITDTWPQSGVSSLALQADGKVILGGAFPTFGKPGNENLARLLPDGSPDSIFFARAGSPYSPYTYNGWHDAPVYAVALQTDGSVLVGGYFSTLVEQSRSKIGRLTATDPARQILGFDGKNILWLRSGSAPEFWLTTFEVSTNATAWADLGSGIRTSVGWHLQAGPLPAGAIVRARGFVAGTSSSFVETNFVADSAVLLPPYLIDPPRDQSANPESTTEFAVEAAGTPPLTYHWFKDGMLLTNDSRVSGANSAHLTLANVQLSDAGSYVVIASNMAGAVTSAPPAVLSVNDVTVPSVEIVSPVAGQGWSNAVLTVTGHASDNRQLAGVWCQVDGSNWISANSDSSWSNWAATVSLSPGTNVIRAFAQDASGNCSQTNAVQVFWTSAPIKVLINGMGTIDPNYDGMFLDFGRTYQMRALPLGGFSFTNWTSNQGTEVKTRLISFQMSPDLELTANFVDNVKPTVVITNPPIARQGSNQWVTSPGGNPFQTWNALSNPVIVIRATSSTNLTFSGIARDNSAVTNVYYRLNSGPLQVASGNRTNWSVTVALQPGLQRVSVMARDMGGNWSVPDYRDIKFEFLNRLTLITNGLGTVTPALSGKCLQVGQRYTLTAKPGSDEWVFDKWTGDATSSEPVLNFIMRPNMALTANFCRNPFPSVKGNYNGLFGPDSARPYNSGAFILTVTRNGSFSGKLRLSGATNSFAGRFDVNGSAWTHIPRPNMPDLYCAWQLDLTNGTDRITGTVETSQWVAYASGDRAVFNATNSCPAAGSYNFCMPGETYYFGSGFGPGYGSLIVDKLGKATISGRFGDGLSMSAVSTVSRYDQCPICIPLVAGRGIFFSWLELNSLDSFFVWMQPGIAGHFYPYGIATKGTLLTSRYIAPTNRNTRILSITNGVITFEAGNLLEKMTNVFTLSSNNAITIESTNSTAILNPTNGTFKGTFWHPALQKSAPFKGVVLQEQNIAIGLFFGINASGSVLLQTRQTSEF